MRLLNGKNTFTSVPRTVREPIMKVETGKLGLPDLQSGYVWRATKVRDLLDSMMKGYPIGYLMIWGAAYDTEKSKAIGIDNKPFSTPILIQYVLMLGCIFMPTARKHWDCVTIYRESQGQASPQKQKNGNLMAKSRQVTVKR